MMSFRDFVYPAITFEDFQALRAKKPKRICFGSIHGNALKVSVSGKAAGFFNVSFSETISALFPWPLFENQNGAYGGYYRVVSDDSEFAQIKAWLDEQGDLVFIRSLFKTAVAACEHYSSQDTRSEIGEFEHSAKYEGNLKARRKLVDVLVAIYESLYAREKIQAVLSVPPSISGQVGLPNYLASELSRRLNLPDLTGELNWRGPKGSVKELDVDGKWNALEQVGMTVSPAVAGKDFLLIDDMYQSGATAHYVASQLRAAGAADLHLLAVSKGRRDTDNT